MKAVSEDMEPTAEADDRKMAGEKKEAWVGRPATKVLSAEGRRRLMSSSRISMGRAEPQARNRSRAKHAQNVRRRNSLSIGDEIETDSLFNPSSRESKMAVPSSRQQFLPSPMP